MNIARKQESRGVVQYSKKRIESHHLEYGNMYFRLNFPEILLAEEHPIANVAVEDREERLQGVALSCDGKSRENKSKERKGVLCSKPYRVHSNAVSVLIRIDICQVKWWYDSGKSRCRMDGCTVFEQFSFYEALGHVGTGACTDESPQARATKSRRRKEKQASTRHAVKRRGGEGAAITHWPYGPEPEQELHQQSVATHHQKYEVHTTQEK